MYPVDNTDNYRVENRHQCNCHDNEMKVKTRTTRIWTKNCRGSSKKMKFVTTLISIACFLIQKHSKMFWRHYIHLCVSHFLPVNVVFKRTTHFFFWKCDENDKYIDAKIHWISYRWSTTIERTLNGKMICLPAPLSECRLRVALLSFVEFHFRSSKRRIYCCRLPTTIGWLRKKQKRTVSVTRISPI